MKAKDLLIKRRDRRSGVEAGMLFILFGSMLCAACAAAFSEGPWGRYHWVWVWIALTVLTYLTSKALRVRCPFCNQVVDVSKFPFEGDQLLDSIESCERCGRDFSDPVERLLVEAEDEPRS